MPDKMRAHARCSIPRVFPTGDKPAGVVEPGDEAFDLRWGRHPFLGLLRYHGAHFVVQ
jgi:hypothetical protein